MAETPIIVTHSRLRDFIVDVLIAMTMGRTPAETTALLGAPDRSTAIGRRDLVFFRTASGVAPWSATARSIWPS